MPLSRVVRKSYSDETFKLGQEIWHFELIHNHGCREAVIFLLRLRGVNVYEIESKLKIKT